MGSIPIGSTTRKTAIDEIGLTFVQWTAMRGPPYAAVAVLLLSVIAGRASAHFTFFVNTTSDHDDGACEQPPLADCTLREAITEANLSTEVGLGPEVIEFDFGFAAVQPFTIELEAPLPPLRVEMTINGSTEPRYSEETRAPVVIIDGGGQPTIFHAGAAPANFIGLAITNATTGISAVGTSDLLILNCYFGIDPLSGEALPSDGLAFEQQAIYVQDGGTAFIGAGIDRDRNVITGGGLHAIRVEGAMRVFASNNYVGVDPTGELARPNDAGRMGLAALHFARVDDLRVTNNIVAGNAGHGLSFSHSQTVLVAGNRIGVTAAGAPLGNDGDAILVGQDNQDVIIGRPGPDEPNTIANNGGVGVRVPGSNASIRANAIYDNRGLGIDNDLPGVSANDAGDELPPLNFPEVTDATWDSGILTVEGCARADAVVDVYETAASVREARAYLGSVNAVSDSETCSENNAGRYLFEADAPQVGRIALTATSAGLSSELSEVVVVKGGGGSGTDAGVSNGGPTGSGLDAELTGSCAMRGSGEAPLALGLVTILVGVLRFRRRR